MGEIEFVIVAILIALILSNLILSWGSFSILAKFKNGKRAMHVRRDSNPGQMKKGSKVSCGKKDDPKIRTPCGNPGGVTAGVNCNSESACLVDKVVSSVASPSRPSLSPMVRHISEISNAETILQGSNPERYRDETSQKTKIIRSVSRKVRKGKNIRRGFSD